MAEIQRGLVQMLQDLDRRARPGREPRNRPLNKFQTIQDTVTLSSDSVTTEVFDTPLQWQTASSSSQRLIWSLGQWR